MQKLLPILFSQDFHLCFNLISQKKVQLFRLFNVRCAFNLITLITALCVFGLIKKQKEREKTHRELRSLEWRATKCS